MYISKSLLFQKITESTDISQSSLDQLFALAVQRELKNKQTILQEGQICKSIVFVEKGSLRTFIDKDGTEINTDFTFEGHFTCNLKSLRTSSPSDTCIQAGENSSIFEFDKDKLLKLYSVSAEIESFGRKLLEQLLIAQEDHVNLFKIYSPTERYHYIERHSPEILQRISLTQLASYLGMARETLSRIRKK